MPEVSVIGHRGAMAYKLENSISSFEEGLKMGAQMLEFDVHLSKDGEVIVMHDERVGRTSNGRGHVGQLTLKELKALKLKNGENIPTLHEVLERFRGRCQFNVEIKGKGVNIPAYEVVKKLGMIDDVLFSSFSGPILLKIKAKDKNVRLACLSNESKINVIKIAKSLKAEAIHPKNNITTKKLIQNAKAEGLEVNVWTVNRVSRMKKLIEWGVDGIFTNKPDMLTKVLNNHNSD
ncbi:MAG: glycerophosphodiester phosphodiesterase [Thermoplasmata archaeon]|nr:glycerophosphodiester phosphodiesterase [Thermoplasmata archaeon]MCK5397637.1 glycerophosphodiester phosphodiesterase [Thermoplasmata archaeon]